MTNQELADLKTSIELLDHDMMCMVAQIGRLCDSVINKKMDRDNKMKLLKECGGFVE